MKLFKNRNFTHFERHTVLRDEFLSIEKILIKKYGFSAFKRRIGRPHIIPGCLFIIVFIACPKRVKKRGQRRIRSGQPYL